MASTAQAVPRQFQLTFGCNRLQELEYFCMMLIAQQFQVCANINATPVETIPL
jgi:hypothetical protein